jgi:glutamate carboxypeptidase
LDEVKDPAEELLAYLYERREQMTEDLRTFVERESPSTDPALLDDFATYLAAYAEEMSGGRATVIPQDPGGNHVRLEVGDTSGPHALMVGHFDTVWPQGTLRTMPFRIEDGTARGPGAFDMKAGLVQGFWALRALRELHRVHLPVVWILNSDEEIGSGTSRPLIEDEARRAAVCMVLEPSFDGALKTARKGGGNFWVDITCRAAHAGSEPFDGISAIDELSRLVLAIHAQTSRETGTTANVGVIEGGTRGNVIAAHARAEVDVRVATAGESERMTRFFRELKPNHPEAVVRIEGGMNHPPMERTNRVAELYATAHSLAAGLGFELPEAAVGGCSDGNFCAAVNPSILDGLGAVGGGAHADSEHVELDDMVLRAALVARLLEAVEQR